MARRALRSFSEGGLRATESSAFLLEMPRAGARGASLCPTDPNRVTVDDDAAPFVAKGKTVFAKYVTAADAEIRPAEEVLVVDSSDRLLATGTALLSGAEMLAFKAGKAVLVRRGLDEDA